MGWFSDLFSGGNIFEAILGGIAGNEERKDAERASKEATREAGTQNRLTSQFEDDQAYYRSQQRRHETSRALDSNYDQFSTVRQWAPNYVAGTGLDAMPVKPNPHNYRNTEDDDD